MDPKFKVGDVVTIRRDLTRTSDSVIPFSVCHDMEDYAGKKATIVDVFPNAKNLEDYPHYPDFDCARYRLDIDERHWCWANVMFETKPFISTTKEEDLLLCCTCF